MNARAAIRQADPAPVAFPTPARAALAGLIDALNGAKQHEEECRAAYDLFRQKQAAAQAALAKATANVNAAKEAQITKAASGGSPMGDRLLANARAHEAEAFDDVQAYTDALPRAQKFISDAEEGVRTAEKGVRRGRQGVVIEEIRTIMAQAVAVQADTVRKRLALITLMEEMYWDAPELKEVSSFLNEADLPAGCGGVNYRDWKEADIVAPFRNFLANLLSDPTAEVPE